jgi:uncharacterized protein YggE
MRTITVKGIGKISAPVDTVELSLRLWAKEKVYDEALDLAAEKVEALENALKNAGFTGKDFQTVGFHVNAEYESVRQPNGGYENVFAGYVCSYDQRLRFDFDNKRLGLALNAVAESKAQPELNVAFTVRNPELLDAELLQSAGESARLRAEALCKAAKVQLGELQKIDYDFRHLNYNSATEMVMDGGPRLAKASRAMAVNLNPADIELQDSAVFMWEIL